MIPCPKCKNGFDVEEAQLDEGDILSCMKCDGNFEVVSFEPLKLAKVSDEEEADDEDDE